MLAILAVAMLAVIFVEAKLIHLQEGGRGVDEALREVHAVCNVGVGDPYQEFIHRLRLLAEAGDTNALVRIVQKADAASRDIYEVWLSGDPESYRKSITNFFK